MQQSTQLQKFSQKFMRQKHKLPKDIAWKLQYMLDYINHTAKPISQLSQQQKNEVKDLQDMTPQALKMVFISIVNSILSPNLYSSFQKNCKIKVDGLISRWISVYVSFQQNQILFTNRKRVFRFVIDGLQCYKISATEMQFKYQKVRKSKVKFQSQQATNSMIAKVTQLIQQHEKQKQKQTGESLILNRKMFQQSLNHDYQIQSKSKQNFMMVHKTQPRVHICLFLKGNFWDTHQVIEYVIKYKFWNNKVAQQKFMEFDKNKLLVERRWKSSHFFSFQRRTLTQINFKQINQNCYMVQQTNFPGQPNSKSIILSQIHLKIIFDLLSPKIIKVTIDCHFNAKGYCNRSSSRKMLIDLLSDSLNMQQKYNKLKQKGKLFFNLPVQQRMIVASEQRNSRIDFLEKREKERVQKVQQIKTEVQQDKSSEKQAYYSIGTNRNYLGDSLYMVSNEIEQKGQQFFDFDNFDDQQFAGGSGNSMDQQAKKNKQQQQEYSTKDKQQCIKKQTKDGDSKKQKLILQQFNKLRPTNYSQKLSVQYIKFVKQKLNEKAYLKKYFQQKQIKNFIYQTPFYDPSIIIPAGKQYQISKQNELIFINYDLIKSQKDSLIFVIKQVGANIISGRSVLGVSMPVDIFQSRSLLQRSAASFGCAPKYFKPVADADVFTQMKAVTGFLMSVPPLQLIMLKPFNPILGQTLQTYIGGVPLCYQQISHHPPISAYYMQCPQFKIHGTLVAVANVSLNSGSGGNAGKMKIVMRNGNQFQVSFMPGEISGLIYGKRKYSICGKGFVFQRTHRLVAELSARKESKGLYQWKDVKRQQSPGEIIGAIFKVKQKFFTDNPPSKSLLYSSGLKKSDIQQRKQLISGLWFSQILIGNQIVNKGITAYPIQYAKSLLPSDSNYRLDVLMHRFNDLARSQSSKQMLESIQRNDRKLRQKFKKN